MWTHQYTLKWFMVQQLHTMRWVLQVIKYEQLNKARNNLLIGSKPKPKPSAPLKRPPPSVVRYGYLHWITSRPSPSGHLGPSGTRSQSFWPLMGPHHLPRLGLLGPGSWGQATSPSLLQGVQAGADRRSDSRRRLTAVCVCVCYKMSVSLMSRREMAK